jgi:hypothetical protein
MSSSAVMRCFLDLAQQARLLFLAGGDVVGDRATRATGAGAGARAGWRGRRGGGLRLGLGLRSGRLAGTAEDAALLDLDHHRVGAAMAEALLDLAGLDRALDAQRRPGTQLRLVGLVAHKFLIYSSSARP